MESETELIAPHLWSLAKILSTTCPAASRLYMSRLKRHLDHDPKLLKKELKPFQFCEHCGSLWAPGNHKIRIQPAPSANAHVKKLLKYEKEQSWKLNNQQKKKLKKFREATSKIVYMCSVCKKSTVFPGIKKYRKEVTSLPSNTSTPKIKLKTGDLNAGLFIKTPVEEKSLNIESDNTTNKQNCTSKDLSNFKNTKLSNSSVQPSSTPDGMKQNVTPVSKSSNKKRKKTLLAQILNQEQEAKKQKKSLSSFLVSL